MPGCTEEALHKAPKDRSLQEYYWFCPAHIQEYNKAWDFFDGMPPEEVEKQILKSVYGDRPTWRYDAFAAAEKILRQKAKSIMDDEDIEEMKRREQQRRMRNFEHTPEGEALRIMELTPPVDLSAIKTRYKILAKRYHPDHNRDDPGAEEMLKRVNMAYTILKIAYQKYEENIEKQNV
ncbi:MAG: DnaJ domain-containing protein [Alphaproteobacteria bacterium]|nr:DnaJ domain-containing protein [Alphaproteobacteria bacterium]